MGSFYGHQKNGKDMGPSPSLPNIHNITIGTMLNLDHGNNAHEIQNVTLSRP